MHFSDDGRTLTILGDVTPGYDDRMVAALNAYPSVREVALGSDGGSVQDALNAGLEIRKRKLDTVLFGDCFSACPLVFLGGVKRIVWSPYPKLGFHQVSERSGKAIALDDPLYDLIASYIHAMGADPTILLGYMFAAGPEQIFVPEILNYCEGGLVTWGQRVCGG
ncbi:hypothetical protein [Roseibium sp.]|uniref:hypothetical protein n=1 Tax=Roseibium sp. TaxID=1936156 RepID=UPI003A98440A